MFSTGINKFTMKVISYNCDCLSNNYAYLRSIVLGELIKKRKEINNVNENTNDMIINEEIQKLALKAKFDKDQQSLSSYEQYLKNNEKLIEQLSSEDGSIEWINELNKSMTLFKDRKVNVDILDNSIKQKFKNETKINEKNKANIVSNDVMKFRKINFKELFCKKLCPYDIMCLQEADYIEPSMFPKNYNGVFSKASVDKKAIVWDKNRYLCIEVTDELIINKKNEKENVYFAVQLIDKYFHIRLLVISGHFAGCNPYQPIYTDGKMDSNRGDINCQQTIKFANDKSSKYSIDITIIGMDTNVTAMHPRMDIIANEDYKIDTTNWEATSTNPVQIVDTRIDHIAMKSKYSTMKIKNIPINSVLLNDAFNPSDHKPIEVIISDEHKFNENFIQNFDWGDIDEYDWMTVQREV